MDTREQRGLALAALYRIDRNDDGKWVVPSQTGNGERYEVDPSPEHPHCTCPDHRDRGIKSLSHKGNIRGLSVVEVG